MNNIRQDFPFFHEHTDLIFCDNAATTQKPASVVEAIARFYRYENAPVHRGAYQLAENATTRYEQVRAQCARFIGAARHDEIIFTKGATDGLNIIAFSWAQYSLSPGDEIVVSELEHHANMIVWQQVAERTGAVIKRIPTTAHGTINYDQLDDVITHKAKIVAMSMGSNVIGVPIDLDPIISRSRAADAYIILDASQAIQRMHINVLALQCDVLVASAHKMLGPTGLGLLYVNKRLHDAIIPWQYGGGMVERVTYATASWRDMPYRCEAGTPPIAQVIGFGAAMTYLEDRIDFTALREHEAALCRHLIDGLAQFSSITILGPVEALQRRGHLVSFVSSIMHAHDIAAYLDMHGICVRAGHHCAQPLHAQLGIASSVRISFYAYNTHAEVEKIMNVLQTIRA
jgi:cysteine desulfurase/selenocysteine lyase